jgi:regulator of protease activity HflC (stomatin/prohibitin superfamily)
MFRKFHVKKDERALLFRKGDFVRVLHPGEHRMFDPFHRVSVEKFAIDKPLFEHRLAEYLRRAEPEVAAREFHVVEIGANEVGLRYENGVIVEILAPDTRRLYWKGFVDVSVAKVDIARDFAIDAALARRLLSATARGQRLPGSENILAVTVPEHHVAVLHVDGKVEALLDAGLHAFWKFRREIAAELVDLRLQVLEVAGQEILTRDKVSLRVNLTAGYRVVDVLAAMREAGEAGGLPLQGAAVRPARGGGNAHPRRAAREQGRDRRGGGSPHPPARGGVRPRGGFCRREGHHPAG